MGTQAHRRLLEAARARQGMQRRQLAHRDEVEMQAEMRWRCKRRCDGDSSTRPVGRCRCDVENRSRSELGVALRALSDRAVVERVEGLVWCCVCRLTLESV